MKNPKFELFQSSVNKQFYFRLKASNGEPILRSEGYVSKQSCENGIASVKKNAPIDERYVRKGSGSHFTFSLKAANGELIGHSEVYTTAASRDQGIESVMKNGPGAPIDDLT
ncbi:DUF1508 domain-containing protein [Chitinophaga lutea]|uniref:DUF1508 domain-containing protein n=1 Tax=Chitinophaga lutea TaxID=2488634 RepID=A0A3N4PM12_9BACT|nr:YegP family protein [Chitinophaga lutea]RPE09732.1 DUF1508 domain-containing protein [Chitinophaga lutea]